MPERSTPLGFGSGDGSPALVLSRKNAPSFIFELVHGRPKTLTGKTEDHRKKEWHGLLVDAHIPEQALEDLSLLKNVEVRSTCEGSSRERPTFCIFRFTHQDWTPFQIEAFVQGMNAIPDIICGAEVGNQGRMRIGVSTCLWYTKDPKAFQQWWLALPGCIGLVISIVQLLLSLRTKDSHIEPHGQI